MFERANWSPYHGMLVPLIDTPLDFLVFEPPSLSESTLKFLHQFSLLCVCTEAVFSFVLEEERQ